MPVQAWKKAMRGFAITIAAISGIELVPAIAASAAPVPAPVTMITVSCSGHALNAAVANALPSSMLSLAPGCTYVLAHGLPVINDSLSLQGPATLTLSARAKATGPILTVGASGNVTTDHVSFTGGNSAAVLADGGAIDNDGGTIGVDFGNFSNNTASGSGGAIYNGRGTLRVFGRDLHRQFGAAGRSHRDFDTRHHYQCRFQHEYRHRIRRRDSRTMARPASTRRGSAPMPRTAAARPITRTGRSPSSAAASLVIRPPRTRGSPRNRRW